MDIKNENVEMPKIKGFLSILGILLILNLITLGSNLLDNFDTYSALRNFKKPLSALTSQDFTEMANVIGAPDLADKIPVVLKNAELMPYVDYALKESLFILIFKIISLCLIFLIIVKLGQKKKKLPIYIIFTDVFTILVNLLLVLFILSSPIAGEPEAKQAIIQYTAYPIFIILIHIPILIYLFKSKNAKKTLIAEGW